jgi:N-carbamoylputrescine amidase
VPPENFRVALVQMSCGPEPEQNLEKALSRVADAAGRGAKVICLPELFQTQYFCQREDHSLFDLAEPIPGPTTEKLSAAARSNGVVLIASLFEKRAAGVYHNTAAIFDSDGSLRGLYRKMHIPDDPLYYEKFYFTPGTSAFAPSIPAPAASERSSAGTSGTRRARASQRCRVRTSCFIRPQSAGIPQRRRSLA